MEQPSSAPPGETTQARGARATREFLDYCLDAEIVFELCKLVLAVCVGVLATLWLTGALAPHAGAGAVETARGTPGRPQHPHDPAAARTGMPAADAHCARADTGSGR